MKLLLFAGLALWQVGATVPPRVTRAMLAGVEQNLDKRLQSISATDPVEVVGLTQGAYLEGYGAVFTGEVNLVMTPGISPFRPEISKEEAGRVRQRKLERLPAFRKAMQDMLVASAASLDPIPGKERIAVAISLFHNPWEDKRGLPSQIVMQGQKDALIAVQAKRADVQTAILVQEF